MRQVSIQRFEHLDRHVASIARRRERMLHLAFMAVSGVAILWSVAVSALFVLIVTGVVGGLVAVGIAAALIAVFTAGALTSTKLACLDVEIN
jgi:hypothetical protein